MKLYSVVLFIIILNLALGGVLMFIQNGMFLDATAYEYISGKLGDATKNYEAMQNAAQAFQNSFLKLQNDLASGNLVAVLADALTLVVQSLVHLVTLFLAALGTIPSLIAVFLGADSVMASMISSIIAVLMGVTLFQLITSRWFTFGE